MPFNVCNIFVGVFDPNYLMLSNISIPYLLLSLPLFLPLSLTHSLFESQIYTCIHIHRIRYSLYFLIFILLILVVFFVSFVFCFALLYEILSFKIHWICLTFVFYFRMKVNVTASNRQWLSWEKKKRILECHAGHMPYKCIKHQQNGNECICLRNISENTWKCFSSRLDTIV